ncbi:MAG: orotidine-5'-phosphate decarboxylase [Gemmatimonadota bacterium]
MAELILALDVPTRDAAVALLDRLPDVRWVKLGSVLATSAGSGFARELKARGLSVFLDLKWHDIPNTVHGAVRGARNLGVDMVTVHTLGGRAMLAAAVEAAGDAMAVVGVTVLTSHSAQEFGIVVGRAVTDLGSEVGRLARLGIESGLSGVVCSPLEVGALRLQLGAGPLLVVPGIRAASQSQGDQARTAGAADTAVAGATHLVVGRPVVDAPDPVAAWTQLLSEACASAY